MSPRLHAYQRLERVMLELDGVGDALADDLRNLMDPLWYALSDDEHAQLDARSSTPPLIVVPTSPGVRTEVHVPLPATLVPLGLAA